VTKKAWLYFATMVVLWGIPYLLIRVAVRQLDPGVLVFGRTAPASLLLLPVVLRRGEFRMIRAHLGWIFAFGVIEFGIPWFCMSTAEQHITSSLTSLIVCTVPMVSMIILRFTSAREPLHARRVLGAGLGMAGVALLVGFDLGHGSGPWIAIMAVVCIGYAVGPVMLATKLKDVSGPAVVCGATGLVALCWLPYTLTHLPHHVHAETWASIAILSIACTGLAFLVLSELVKVAGSNRSLVVVYLNTALAVTLGILFLREPFTIGIALGFPLIVAGSYLGTRKVVQKTT
jgi:drug/metabolite transporter (DMT)-like permease